MDNINILLTCPNCGNSTWLKTKNGFECLACGDIYKTEEMSPETKPAEKQILKYADIIEFFNNSNLKPIQPMIASEVSAKTVEVSPETFEAICRDVFDLCQGYIEAPVVSEVVDLVLKDKYPTVETV